MEILVIIIFLLICFYIFLVLVNLKINKLEEKIKTLFIKRTSAVTSVFEVSKDFLTKHNEIFKEYIRLKKIEFAINSKKDTKLYKVIELESKIHHEINFIFKTCNLQPRLLKVWNFLYLRDIIIDQSLEIWKNIELYKSILKNFNLLIKIKNITIIGLLFPIWKKEKI